MNTDTGRESPKGQAFALERRTRQAGTGGLRERDCVTSFAMTGGGAVSGSGSGGGAPGLIAFENLLPLGFGHAG
ncbi:MAG TPA: hypothetical protein P5069_15170, partial [Candidatus Hydrogenedentes bacterium]|nr:hypothetical protein [Candidatus Hydrogenedentota bacterium]